MTESARGSASPARSTESDALFARHAVSSLAAQAAILVSGAATAVIVARALGPELRGHLAMLVLVPWTVMTLGRFGLNHSVNFYAPRTDPEKLVVSSMALSLSLGVAATLLAAATLPIVKSLFLADVAWPLVLAAGLMVPWYILRNHVIALMQAFYEIGLRNFIEVCQAAGTLVLAVALLVLLQSRLPGAMVVQFAPIVVVVLVGSWILARRVRQPRSSYDGRLARDLFSYGLRAHVGNVLKDLSYRGDIFIVAYFLDATSVGHYVVAVTLAEVLLRIPDAVGGVLLPRVAHAAGRTDAVTPRVARVVVAFVLLACLITFVIREDLVVLAFGQDFLPAAAALGFLLPGIVSLSLWKVLANSLLGQGFPRHYSVTAGVGLATIVVFDLVLVPSMGIRGAALASSIAYTVAAGALAATYIRMNNVSLMSILVPNRRDWDFVMQIARKTERR